ncbi:MAG TPA: glycosyltransferase 87 family protein [Jiangellaceae bacterium]
MNTPIALPSRDDPLVSAASEAVGGPVGRRAAPGRGWWGPVRVALAVACVVLGLGVLADAGCHNDRWENRGDRAIWTGLCYSDVAFLYRERGLADGLTYRDAPLEYPVLTAAVIQVSAYAARALAEGGDTGSNPAEEVLVGGLRFYDVTAVLMGLAALGAVVATARTVPRRPWDAMLVAASPVLLLTATINWDLLAVALTSLAVLAWTRKRPVLAGLMVGLGAAAKLYPVLLLGPMLVLAWREPDRRRAVGDYLVTLGTAVAAWAAVNLPAYLWAPDGWRHFYAFNTERRADLGSPWYAIDLLVPDLLPDRIEPVLLTSAVVLLTLVVLAGLAAPEPPRLAQLAFLAVAAFLLVNKVWSPQYALWLLPLAALARPRWRDLLIWQGAEVLYFVAVWWHLATLYDSSAPLIGSGGFAAATAIRIGGLAWLAGVVVRDIMQPRSDLVRPYVDHGNVGHSHASTAPTSP